MQEDERIWTVRGAVRTSKQFQNDIFYLVRAPASTRTNTTARRSCAAPATALGMAVRRPQRHASGAGVPLMKRYLTPVSRGEQKMHDRMRGGRWKVFRGQKSRSY
jgi:hypothetical protein